MHLLTCRRAPADAAQRILALLHKILDEVQPPDPGAPSPPRTRSQLDTALTYIYRLEWPKISKITLITILKGLGRLINTYRNSWSHEPGVINPIWRIYTPK